jgi:hypothetical protein
VHNLRVAVALYGPYPHGAVIPAAVPLGYGTDPEALVRNGTLAWTDDRVNCAVAAPPADAGFDAAGELLAERNGLRERADRAERAEKLLAAKAAELEKQVGARDAALAKQVAAAADEVAHLTEACEAHQGRVGELEAELAAAKDLLAEAAKAPPEK